MTSSSPPVDSSADDPAARFAVEVRDGIAALGADDDLRRASLEWIESITRHRYVYNFTWLGRPIVQLPQDAMAIQEIIWNTRPDLIIETGIAHGGSLILSASILALLGGDRRRVVGVDIEIRPHNRAAIESHPLSRLITLIEGSSTDPQVVDEIHRVASGHDRVMVILDSNHAHAHVLEELEAYGPLVTRDCYLLVFDTVIEDLPAGLVTGRPWDKGDNPKTAVHTFLDRNDRFEIDRSMADKLVITTAPDGFLRARS